MNDSRRRRFSRVFGTFLQTLLGLVLLGVVVFFALTRTEVGRDRLRQEVETQVSAQLRGSLEIGVLRGNLINDLYATDVRMRAPDGTSVIEVDSLVVRPSWTALISQQLRFREVTLYRPHVRLHRQADSTWSIQSAFQRRVPRDAPASPLDLSVGRVEVIEGRVTTTRDTPLPSFARRGWLFDYATTEVRDVHLAGEFDWRSASRFISLDRFTAQLPDPGISLNTLRGTVEYEAGAWTLSDALLETGATVLRMQGSYAPSEGARSDTVTADPARFDVTLDRSQINFTELRRLSPRLPLRDALVVDGDVNGTPGGIVLNGLNVSRGASDVRLSGTVFGLPERLDLDLHVDDSYLTRSDVRAVWPGGDIRKWTRVTTSTVDVFVQGGIQWRDQSRPTFDLDTAMQLATSAGAVRGSLAVARALDGPTRYDGTLRTDSLDVAALVRPSGLNSRLNGTVRVEGQGLTRDALNTRLALALSPSVIGTQAIDSLDVDLTVQGQTAFGQLSLLQSDGGRVDVNGEFDGTEDIPRYSLQARSLDLDVQPLRTALPRTRYNATLTTIARGTDWESLTGTLTLDVDSSTIVRPDSTYSLRPHRTTLTLREAASDSARIDVQGDVASLSVRGDVPGTAFVNAGRLWTTALRGAARSGAQKPYPRSDPYLPTLPDSVAVGDTSRASVDVAELREATRTALQDAGYGSRIRTDARLQVHAPDLARAYLPFLPPVMTDADVRAALVAGPDTLNVTTRLRASSLGTGPQMANGLAVTVRTSGSLDRPLVETVSGRVYVQADSVRVRDGFWLDRPTVDFDYAERNGTFFAEALGRRAVDTMRVRADLRALPSRNIVTIRDVRVGTQRGDWTLEQPGVIDLYSDAAVVSPFSLTNPRTDTDAVQQVRLGGRLTGLPSDTVFVEADGVSLYPLVTMAGSQRLLGGLLDGRVVLSGGLRSPVVESDLTVHRLSFDRRLLGTVDVGGRYERGSPDVSVNLALRPVPLSLDSTDVTRVPLVPGGLRRTEPSRLNVDGTIRVPALAPAETTPDLPDAPEMDLAVNVDRADLFFFEYIFESEISDVSGYTAGAFTITGPFTDPTFDADMVVRDGAFSLPRFGLTYAIGGAVRVDRVGIHMQDVIVDDGDGDATLNGSLLFNEYKFFSFDLEGNLNEIQVINVTENESADLPFYGNIRATGPASLTGPLPDATLRSPGVRTTPESELFIPTSEGTVDAESGFIIFADSTGAFPDLRNLTQRDNILADRPAGEPSFVDGLDTDINIQAPEGSTVHLVFDPLVGDVVTAVGSGRVQLLRQEGEFLVFGRFDVSGGNYLFTAGEVFVRRFSIDSGSLTWDGDPVNARMDIAASYRTRASTAGLDRPGSDTGRIPVVVQLGITGRVETPRVDLSLALARDQRSQLAGTQTLDAVLNQPELATEYATSVLLTNTFLLTTSTIQQSAQGSSDGLADAGNQLAFNSVSQLVASQLNRYLSAALPNVDVNLGLQGNNPEDLDVIYGVALRLLNERLIIRGEGIYQTEDPSTRQVEGPQGEVVIEVKLNDRVSAEVFYRREGDDIAQQALTRSAGAGLSYQTEFSTWKRLFNRLFGWLMPGPDAMDTPGVVPPPDSTDVPAVPDSTAPDSVITAPPPSSESASQTAEPSNSPDNPGTGGDRGHRSGIRNSNGNRKGTPSPRESERRVPLGEPGKPQMFETVRR